MSDSVFTLDLLTRQITPKYLVANGLALGSWRLARTWNL